MLNRTFSKSFNEYLMDRCMEVNDDEMLVDDEWPNFYDNWIADQTADDIMAWAELFGQEQYIKGQSDLLKEIQERIK